jgi:hypothetical protein
MTVAAGIEMETGTQSAPGQRSGSPSTAAGSLQSSAAGAENFRSGWRSMLAMLGEEQNGLAPQSAVTNKCSAAAAAPANDEARNNGPAIQAFSSVQTSRLALQNPQPGAADNLSALSVARRAAAAHRPTAADILENAQAAEESPDKSGDLPSATSNRTPRREAGSAAKGQALRKAENGPQTNPEQGTPDLSAYPTMPVPQGVRQPKPAALHELTSASSAKVFLAASEPPAHASSTSPLSARPGNASINAGGIIVQAASVGGNGARAKVQLEPDPDDARAAQHFEHPPPGEGSSTADANRHSTVPATGITANAASDGTIAGADLAAASLQPAADPVSADPVNFGASIAESGRYISGTLAARPSRGAGAPSNRALPMPSVSSVAGAADPARDLQSTHGAMSPLRPDPGGAMGSGGGPGDGSGTGSTRETFAALDADSGPGMTGWIHAGIHAAEAGFEDPALGWVGVKADLGAGGVHAAVVPGTAEAVAALSGHMAGLNAYLAEHRTPVESLTLASPDGRGTDGSISQGMQQDGGHDAGRGDSSAPSKHAGQSALPVSGTASREASFQGSTMSEFSRSARPAGTYISVMA